MKKNRIFIVMYNFMPIGIGRGIAWNCFAEKLQEKGYEVEIVTVEPSLFDPYYNEGKNKLISSKVKITRIRDANFYYRLYNKRNLPNATNTVKTKKVLRSFLIKTYKLLSRIIFYPDRMKYWSKKAKKYIVSKKIKKDDLLISVAFPFSTHIQMCKIKKKYNCKLILDYGDPWSFNPSPETEPTWRKWIDRIVEKRIIKKADLITVTTETTKKEFEKKLKYQNCVVIRQGADLNVYKKNDYNKNNKNNKNTKKITVVYTGTFYKEIRDPSFFFEQLILLDKRLNCNVDFIIAGVIDDCYKEIIEKKALNSMKNIKLILLGNIPFLECVELQCNADILLFFSNKTGIQVPGKLYEYLATSKPIICISYAMGETEEILLKNRRGCVFFNGDDKMFIKLFNLFNEYKTHKTINGIVEEKIFKYDWENVSKTLIKTIDGVTKNEKDNNSKWMA